MDYKHNIMATLQIDLSGSKGLAPKYFGDVDKIASNPELRILADDGQMVEGIYNPFRRLGYMSPSTSAFNTVTTTNDVTSRQFCTSLYDEINNDFYLAEYTGTPEAKIFKGDGLDDLGVDWGHQITDGTITDLAIYERNGVRKLYYTFKKSGADDMGIADLPIDSRDDDFLSTVATSGFSLGDNNHRMIVADNGYMYILDGNAVHKFDGSTDGGANGTAEEDVITFPSNFQLVDAVDYNGALWIIVLQNKINLRSGFESETAHSNKCGIYVWDRSSTTFNTRQYIPLSGLKYAKHIYISPKGDVRLMAIGANRIAQIMGYDGSTFQPIVELGVDGCPRHKSGIQVGADMTYFLTELGHIMAHGAIFPNKSEGIYKLAETVSTTNFAGGALLLGSSNGSGTGQTGYRSESDALYVSYFVSPTIYNKKFYINGSYTIQSASQTTEKGNVYTPVKYLPKLSTVNKLIVYMATGATSSSDKTADIKIYFNQSSTPWATKAITRTDGAKGYIDIPINKQNVNSIQIEIEFNSATTLGVWDFAPSMALVEYTPTNTNG